MKTRQGTEAEEEAEADICAVTHPATMASRVLFAFAATAAVAATVLAVPSSLRARLSDKAPEWQPAAPRNAAPAAGTRCSPLDFGADASGVADSAPALAECVSFCVNYSRTIDFLGHFPGDASFGNGKYIANAGESLVRSGPP